MVEIHAQPPAFSNSAPKAMANELAVVNAAYYANLTKVIEELKAKYDLRVESKGPGQTPLPLY